MQEINHKKGKIYYSMGEVAEMFDVNHSLLRFWEQEFDILKPHRNKKGNRLFTPEDVDNIRIIYHLLKERKMKIEVARKYIKDYRKEVDRDAEITERLMNVRAVLLEIKQDFLYDGQVVDDSYDDDSYEDDKFAGDVTDSSSASKPVKKQVKPIKKTSATIKDNAVEAKQPQRENSVIEEAIDTEAAETVQPVSDEASSDIKPPFQEQVLFDVAVPLELVQNIAAVKSKDGFESAKAAFIGAEILVPEDPEQEEKPRPQVIEQTLF